MNKTAEQLTKKYLEELTKERDIAVATVDQLNAAITVVQGLLGADTAFDVTLTKPTKVVRKPVVKKPTGLCIDKVRSVLSSGKPTRVSDIITNTGSNNSSVGNALRRLVKLGEIRKMKHGLYVLVQQKAKKDTVATKVGTVEDQVLAAMGDRLCTSKDITLTTGRRRKSVQHALARLILKGKVKKQGAYFVAT